jgi:hypothetical protein
VKIYLNSYGEVHGFGENYDKIKKLLSTIKKYDIISIGTYFYYAHGLYGVFAIDRESKYVIHSVLYGFFEYYDIKYNEDINDLYDTPGKQWYYHTERAESYRESTGLENLILPLASRYDNSDKVIPYRIPLLSNQTFYVIQPEKTKVSLKNRG